MSLLIAFPGTPRTSVAEVGGKGKSLIRMAEAGLPVPPGAVLTTDFFAPWFDEIQASAAWTALTSATPDERAALCDELKGLCLTFPLTADQRRTLEDLREDFAERGIDGLLAVRSSSPDEDLVSASFAGGYETQLGVRPADLEEAVQFCFASNLDERVLVYREEHGFDTLSMEFAVVVQRQIDSVVAGVGFSLDPLTNDFDTAVIDANWGLGESVVAGLVSPDHFVVDKVGRQVLDSTPGAKQVSKWLLPDGGTTERKNHRSKELTLSDAQLIELTDVMCRIEALYEQPVDIEWAYAGDRLYVLQARPITTYVPLAPEMLTRPGEPRRLYADGALSKGMTTNSPISPMGLDWVEDFYSTVLGIFGIEISIEKGLMFFAGGRMYMNLSNLMWLGGFKRMSKASTPNDALLAGILANIDEQQYRASTRPPWVRFGNLLRVPGVLWKLRRVFWTMFNALVFPERAHRAYQRAVKAYDTELTQHLDYGLPLGEFRQIYAEPMWRQGAVTMAALAAGLAAVGLVPFVVGRKSAALAEKLQLDFTGDVVVEMGIALFRLARLLEPSDLGEPDRLAEGVENRRLPAEFLNAWDGFLSKYGWRGPSEMDLASPRYADDPGLALEQMSLMAVDDRNHDPEVAHQHQVEERRRAYAKLMGCLSWPRRMLLRRIHRMIELFAGSRDMPKHELVLFNYAIRKRLLIEGDRLVREGRLDAAENIFDLALGDLESGNADRSLNLREIREQRTRFHKVLETRVTEFPQVIDSRGRIIRPTPREEQPGELTGMAVSPGVVTGPVNVLRGPREKRVRRGDVLVAYTTDPGWTPLFVNAAAVVLEVGGVLQHGALVAREYGKPCVVGIDRVTARLHDGQMVEVDGTAGVIRVL